MKNPFNRLIHEPSIYLRQHARNPVDWYPWGEEAFHKAISENKPVLVSIGYSACHWCHVMQRESFEDNDTAALMNELFVNIKVDREERPDLDQIYMDAVQAMTGSGGWPLNVFLTPNKAPFYGGTYFPHSSSAHHMSWKQVLVAVSDAFRTKRQEVDRQALSLTTHIQQASLTPGPVMPEPEEADLAGKIYSTIMAGADTHHGGFGRAPKFPSTFLLGFLLRYYKFRGEKEALLHVELSLDQMIAGGIYDQVGGAFCRYSTDAAWQVPHFEKMLYDNALLVELISEAYQVTGKPAYGRTIRRTLGYISREMSSPEGGFFAALDADSEGKEGKFYVWDKKELDQVLGEDAGWFCHAFGVTAQGNWEGSNIPRRTSLISDLDEEKLDKMLDKLLAARQLRPRPQLDDKVLLGWNALMCSGFCRAFAALGDPRYREAALRNFQFIWDEMRSAENGSFFHCWQAGKARQAAFLDDYAFLVSALISLQEITADRTFLIRARELTDQVITRFWDEKDGYFFFAPADQQDLLVRRKDLYDGPTPSGNAVMCRNLEYLSTVFDDARYREMAEKMASPMKGAIIRYPGSFGKWAELLIERARGHRELAIVGPDYGDWLSQALETFLPGTILMASPSQDDRFSLLTQRGKSGRTLAYVCRDHVCLSPAETPGEALAAAGEA